MDFRNIKSGEYEVIISEGGVSVITDPGADYCADVSPPENVSALSEIELQDIADEAVADWEKFLKGMDEL